MTQNMCNMYVLRAQCKITSSRSGTYRLHRNINNTSDTKDVKPKF